MRNKDIFKNIIIVVLLFIVIVLGWGLYAMNKNENQADWNDTNQQNGQQEPFDGNDSEHGDDTQNGSDIKDGKGDDVATSFIECVIQGNPVMESYPRKCTAKNGEVFTEDLGNVQEKQDLIQVETPQPNTFISSPLVVKGQARGNWFFEATFPIVVVDWDGLIIGEGYATADGEWMTENFVPFTAEIEFSKPTYKQNGAIILQKANPSGLPEHDDALEYPIIFEK